MNYNEIVLIIDYQLLNNNLSDEFDIKVFIKYNTSSLLKGDMKCKKSILNCDEQIYNILKYKLEIWALPYLSTEELNKISSIKRVNFISCNELIV